MIYSFGPNDYSMDTKIITLNAEVVRHNVTVKSQSTGDAKVFVYDSDQTTKEYMDNEGWDGEQNIAIFHNVETDVTLRVWETPYDNF